MTEKYRPVSCELYSKLEMWIMHHERLRLAWHDEDGEDHIGIIAPGDLQTESGSEFLVFTDLAESRPHKVRLDRIIKAELFYQ